MNMAEKRESGQILANGEKQQQHQQQPGLMNKHVWNIFFSASVVVVVAFTHVYLRFEEKKS